MNFETLKVPLNWTNGEEMTVEQWGQREYDSGLKTGRDQGVSMCVMKLREMACRLFADSKDDQAVFLRKVAIDIEMMGKS